MNYSPKTLSYFEQNAHAGSLVGSDVLMGEAASSSSQESLRFYLQLEGEHVKQCRFQANASVASIAGAEFAAEWCETKTLAEVFELKAEQIMAVLELPPLKIHAALLVITALNNTIATRKS